MSTFETLLSIVLLIFVLSVIVQAIQEVLKSALNTKATVMSQTIDRFMGDHLSQTQVVAALSERGLNLEALEALDTKGFRELLEGVNFQQTQLQGIVQSASIDANRVKDNIASAYDGVRDAFQKAYTRKNKLFALGISFVVVLALDANIISLYQQISVDAIVQQTLVGQAGKLGATPQNISAQGDLTQAYQAAESQIDRSLQNYPVLIRTKKYPEDFSHPFNGVIGLAIMGVLVSLGAPFWNDVLKSLMGVNNALNTQPKNTP